MRLLPTSSNVHTHNRRAHGMLRQFTPLPLLPRDCQNRGQRIPIPSLSYCLDLTCGKVDNSLPS